jgi:hypothetical protein
MAESNIIKLDFCIYIYIYIYNVTNTGNFGIASSLPSWLNEKHPSISISRTISATLCVSVAVYGEIHARSCCTVVYILIIYWSCDSVFGSPLSLFLSDCLLCHAPEDMFSMICRLCAFFSLNRRASSTRSFIF